MLSLILIYTNKQGKPFLGSSCLFALITIKKTKKLPLFHRTINANFDNQIYYTIFEYHFLLVTNFSNLNLNQNE